MEGEEEKRGIVGETGARGGMVPWFYGSWDCSSPLWLPFNRFILVSISVSLVSLYRARAAALMADMADRSPCRGQVFVGGRQRTSTFSWERLGGPFRPAFAGRHVASQGSALYYRLRRQIGGLGSPSNAPHPLPDLVGSACSNWLAEFWSGRILQSFLPVEPCFPYRI